jgi:hypothetical protein
MWRKEERGRKKGGVGIKLTDVANPLLPLGLLQAGL